MTFRKSLAIIMAVAMVGGVAAGCSDGGETASTGAASSAAASAGGSEDNAGGELDGGGVELELLMTKPETTPVMEEIAAQFNEEFNTNITVTSTSDGATVIRTRLSANEMPDLMNTFPLEDFYKSMFADGRFVDITDQEFLSKVSPDTLALSEYEGAYYAVPMSVSTYGIYVNNTVLQENGIEEVPTTWDELMEACETLTANGVTAFLMPDQDVGNVAQRFERTVGVINNDSDSEFQQIANGEMTAADSPTLNAWCDYNDQLLLHCNADHMGMDYDVACASFSNNEGAFMLSGTWMLSTIKQNNPDADVTLIAFPNPTGGETKVPINMDTSFSVGETCANMDIGLRFLEYMTQPEIAQKYCDADGNVSLIEGVEYNIPQHQAMVEAVDSGSVFVTAVNFWPTGLREEIRASCQTYLQDQDRDAFLAAAQTAIETIYNG